MLRVNILKQTKDCEKDRIGLLRFFFTILAIAISFQAKTQVRTPAIVSPQVFPDQTVTFRISVKDADSAAVRNTEQDSTLISLLSDPAKINRDLRLFWIGCDTEDGLFTGNKS